MRSEPFRFSEQQARITAKWEIGVRNIPAPFAVCAAAVMVGCELLRYFVFKLPAPPAAVYIADAAALCGMLIALHYIERRTAMTAREIMKRRFVCEWDEKTAQLLVHEEGVGIVFRTMYADILRIDLGEEVFRVAARYGAVCLPRAQLSDELLAQFTAQLGEGEIRKRGWM